MANSSVSSVASSPIYEPEAKSRLYKISIIDEVRRKRMNEIRDEMVEMYGDLYMPSHVDKAVQKMRDRLKRNGELTTHGELIFPSHINRSVAQIHHKFSLTHTWNKSSDKGASKWMG